MQIVALHHEVQELKQERTGLGHKVASLSAALAASADCNRRMLQVGGAMRPISTGAAADCVASYAYIRM